jgi:hypothetical protein
MRADTSNVTRDRDIAAILLFLVCAGAFAYTGWSRPTVAPFSGADASVYRESYRQCEREWREERASGPEPRPAAMAATWAGRYDDDRRTAARTGCLDAIAGKPPQV